MGSFFEYKHKDGSSIYLGHRSNNQIEFDAYNSNGEEGASFRLNKEDMLQLLYDLQQSLAIPRPKYETGTAVVVKGMEEFGTFTIIDYDYESGLYSCYQQINRIAFPTRFMFNKLACRESHIELLSIYEEKK